MLAIGAATLYNVPRMNESQVDVVQLQKRDPQAWTALLAGQDGLEDVVVTAVTAQPLHYNSTTNDYSRRVSRYLVSLANNSDPIPFIGKKTTLNEALFYRDLAPTLPSIVPRCWFVHIFEDAGWVVIEDVPNHVRRDRLSHQDVEEVLGNMVEFHAAFWDQPEIGRHYSWLPHFVDRDHKRYTWRELRQEYPVYFEQGPSALLSEHALIHTGRLTPRFLEAANGLAVMRSLGGWPGVLGESHLAAAEDLLDDPVPMLEPLLHLPSTLLHGNMHKYHWHLTLFRENRLLDWRNVALGPAILDVVSFQEQFDLLFSNSKLLSVNPYEDPPVTEETIIDSYLLAMKAELSRQFDARQMRLAIPAARCLQILTTSFPYFATWFDQMPDKYTWQRVNRMTEPEPVGRSLDNIIRYRPYLRKVFQRFLQAYRML
ncbi:MAG: phosphotransferase [Anaerolineaceae bacterium]|nr:MAG: phosphotransferase [Anaerolineaceae bacterium]